MSPRASRLVYADARPHHATLRPVLERVWVVRGTSASRAPEHIVPDACPELIVHLADPYARQVRGRWVRQPRAFLAGTLTRPWQVRPGPRVHTLGLRFKPGAVRAVFDLDMKTATDREIALERLVGAGAARELLAALRAARGRAALFRAAEAWLLERHATVRVRPADATRPGVARFLARRGRERVEDAAHALGVSRRALERAFARDLGISPKRFARIVRLNAVLARLGAAERTRAVDLALEAGYFDQAHLARDFRAVAGRRAARGRELDGELARHFTHPERLLALLAGE